MHQVNGMKYDHGRNKWFIQKSITKYVNLKSPLLKIQPNYVWMIKVLLKVEGGGKEHVSTLEKETNNGDLINGVIKIKMEVQSVRLAVKHAKSATVVQDVVKRNVKSKEKEVAKLNIYAENYATEVEEPYLFDPFTL
mmetsp:Transcript_7234/g.15036  ORF Transcript_7234/g.15036 Transcript_7234/m.15036 type:complete len:137 (+) Transcript_7234:876-1286(+)